MNRILAVFITCLLAACSTDRSSEIDRAMRHYDQLVLHMQSDSIANMFLMDGELASENRPSIFGRDSITRLLKSFKGASVLKNESTTKTTTLKGDSAVQEGSYIQIVKIPSGDTLELGGQYTATWVKQNRNEWLIKKMSTHHYRNLKDERLKKD